MVKELPQRLFLGQDYRSPVSVKVFSSWDFCIRGQEAATIKKHEISNEFKVCASVWCVYAWVCERPWFGSVCRGCVHTRVRRAFQLEVGLCRCLDVSRRTRCEVGRSR